MAGSRSESYTSPVDCREIVAGDPKEEMTVHVALRRAREEYAGQRSDFIHPKSIASAEVAHGSGGRRVAVALPEAVQFIWRPNTVPKATPIDVVLKDAALESQIMEVPKKSGDITENNNDKMNDLLRSILKTRDNILHKEHILQDRSAKCDMDIQNILNEGKMTPKVLTIMEKYKGTNSNMMEVANPSCCGDGDKTRRKKRKTLKEALLHNKCQELNEICRDIKCIPPRYTVLPSLEDGMFHAHVHFTCPGYDMSITGGPHLTPDGARCSAAAILITELRKKATKEEEHEHDANIPS
ncbi:hypothetical protein CFC21_072543 [Triticum aestivum]|uniref:DRBM domain-containing protein n=2 Tax=Triticum aestivum TaxID=4565 RepID=A0A3B6LQ63_WHEAT|nr:uncharacterized protein LOC123116546 [Triticum aestivum]KAF7066589.1 hypothetical protein CFC21_072543 [Triticum aestivum]